MKFPTPCLAVFASCPALNITPFCGAVEVAGAAVAAGVAAGAAGAVGAPVPVLNMSLICRWASGLAFANSVVDIPSCLKKSAKATLGFAAEYTAPGTGNLPAGVVPVNPVFWNRSTLPPPSNAMMPPPA
jgi:hypothetical protein